MDTVGQRVKVLREIRGMSQSELSRRVRITPQAIQSLEADKNPERRTRHVVGIAAALDFDAKCLDIDTPRHVFQRRLAEEENPPARDTPELTADIADADQELVDAAIKQASKTVAMHLKLNNEKISGREYLRRLSDELQRLTSQYP